MATITETSPHTDDAPGDRAGDIQIDVFSDAICPWCYLGKRRLERAIDELGAGYRVDVAWRPFQLNPGTPKEGVDRQEYLAQSGHGTHIRRSDVQLRELGAADGITYDFEHIARLPNTFDAHRLAWFAGQHGHQNAAVDAIFRAYFTEGRDVGDRRVLSDVAGVAGLNPVEVQRFLESDEGVIEVRQEEQEGRELGISGVPFFVVDGRYAISGAQSVETFVAALQQVRREHEAEDVSADGAACSVDDPEGCA